MPSTFLDYITSTDDPGGGRRIGGRRRPGDRDPRGFAEAISLTGRVLSGDRWAALQFEEALGTSDFSYLFADIIDRSMVAAYQEYPSEIMSITKQTTVRDFRTSNRFALDGAEGLLDEVEERAPYREAPLSDSKDTISVGKFGRRIDLSWEALVNDDLGSFRDLPSRLGKAARRSEQAKVASMWVGAAGLNTALFTGTAGAGGNILSGNPVLTTDNLDLAIRYLNSQTDADGQPIFIGGVYLVTGRALKPTARRILDTTEFRVTDGDGNVRIVSGNAVTGNLTHLTDPYVDTYATSNAATTWAVFADPNEGRPALEFAKLMGHDVPEIWAKSPDAQRIGGGTVGPEAGSFENDSIAWRVRHVYGGAQRINTGGRKAVVGSNGSGS